MRRQGGHEQFDGPGGVHFLADDPLGLAQRPQAQRQIGIRPGHHLVDSPARSISTWLGISAPSGVSFIVGISVRVQSMGEGLGIGD